MSIDRYLNILRTMSPIEDRRLTAVRSILEYIESVNVPKGTSTALWLFVYKPRQEDEPALRDALLRNAGVRSRVPVSRIELDSRRRQGFALLELIDSPAYTAFPPRKARGANQFIAPTYRGLDLLEGLWLTLLCPDIIAKLALDLVGSRYSIECTPTIYQWDGARYLSAIAPDSRDEMCRPIFVRKTLKIAVEALDRVDALHQRLKRCIDSSSPAPMF